MKITGNDNRNSSSVNSNVIMQESIQDSNKTPLLDMVCMANMSVK